MIPLFPNKWAEPPLHSAGVFLDALRAQGWEPGIVPRSVIFTYARFELYLGTQTEEFTPNHMLGTGPGRFFLVNDTDHRVAVNCLGTGPAVTATELELQAELGVERFIVIGTCGGLTTELSPGDIVVPTEAVRDDGTSDHYANPDVPAQPTPSLTNGYAEALAARRYELRRGPTWTTSAPFRESAAEVDHYVSHGVLTVEEEAPTLFTVGQYRDRTQRQHWSWTEHPTQAVGGTPTSKRRRRARPPNRRGAGPDR